MKSLHRLIQIGLRSLLAGTIVVAAQVATLQGQTGVKPSAIATGVAPPSRQRPILMMPGAFSTEPRRTYVSQYGANGNQIPAVQVPQEIPVPRFSYWIVTTPSVLPATPNPRRQFWWYPNTPGQSGCLCDEAVFKKSVGSNSAPICIIAHGFGYNFVSVRNEAPEFSRALWNLKPNSDVNIVFFSWPSNAACVPAEVLTGEQSARHGRFALAPLLEELSKDKPRNVCLIGHSYGARVILSALHSTALREAKDSYLRDARYKAVPSPNQWSRYRAVLLAGAIRHDKLMPQESWEPDENYDLALARVECLLNVFNRRDYALNLYSIFGNYPLGQTGFYRDYCGKFCEIDREEDRNKVSQKDVTDHLGPRHGARFYLTYEVGEAIRPYVFFDQLPSGAR